MGEQKGKPILFGHSWGGVLAIEYAMKNQKKLSGVITMSTGLNSEQWVLYRKELQALGLQDAKPEEVFLTSVELERGRVLLKESWEGFFLKVLIHFESH